MCKFLTSRSAGRGCSPQPQIDTANQRAGRKEDGAFDGVIKLAYVSGPRVLAKRLHRGGIEARDLLAVALGIDAQEMMREKFDVTLAFPQVGEADLDRV